MEQLSLFGVSSDQQQFFSELWGKLDFYETGNDKWTDNCRHCLLYRQEECNAAPCKAAERKDGKKGYFSIHEMPNL